MAFWKRKNKNNTPQPSQNAVASPPASTSTTSNYVPSAGSLPSSGLTSRPAGDWPPVNRPPAPGSHSSSLGPASRPITPSPAGNRPPVYQPPFKRPPATAPLLPPGSHSSSPGPASRPITPSPAGNRPPVYQPPFQRPPAAAPLLPSGSHSSSPGPASQPVTPRVPVGRPPVGPALSPPSSGPNSRPITPRVPVSTPLAPSASQPASSGPASRPVTPQVPVNAPLPSVPVAPSNTITLPSRPPPPPAPQPEPIAPTKRTPTDSSYYSCSNLPTSNDARYLKAAEVRRQVAEAPTYPIRFQGPNPKKLERGRYPHRFYNDENIPLQSEDPWREYPILPAGSWNARIEGTQGAARAIYNQDDRSKFDVTYHDPTKGRDHYKNMSLASYRPAVGVAQVKA